MRQFTCQQNSTSLIGFSGADTGVSALPNFTHLPEEMTP